MTAFLPDRPDDGASVATTADPVADAQAKPRRRRVKLSWSMRIGVGMLVFYVAVAMLSLVWTPFDPLSPGIGDGYLPPTSTFLLGTDRLGADVLSRLMAGARYDLGITFGAIAIALTAGTVLGTFAGYYGGAIDLVILRAVEMFQAFPGLLFAMLIVRAVGPGLPNIILVLSFVGIPDYLRLARAEIRSRRNWQYAEAARMVGNPSWMVAFRHLLPNSAGPLLAFTSINAAFVALVTASLGFLGLGLDPNTPEWGNMIARGQDGIMTGQWWVSFFPGLAILGLTGGFYLLGDALADFADPRRRR